MVRVVAANNKQVGQGKEGGQFRQNRGHGQIKQKGGFQLRKEGAQMRNKVSKVQGKSEKTKGTGKGTWMFVSDRGNPKIAKGKGKVVRKGKGKGKAGGIDTKLFEKLEAIPASKKVWVGSLNPDTTWKQLSSHIEEVTGTKPSITNMLPKGGACLAFESNEDASSAIALATGTELQGSTIESDVWTQKENKGRGAVIVKKGMQHGNSGFLNKVIKTAFAKKASGKNAAELLGQSNTGKINKGNDNKKGDGKKKGPAIIKTNGSAIIQKKGNATITSKLNVGIQGKGQANNKSKGNAIINNKLPASIQGNGNAINKNKGNAVIKNKLSVGPQSNSNKSSSSSSSPISNNTKTNVVKAAPARGDQKMKERLDKVNSELKLFVGGMKAQTTHIQLRKHFTEAGHEPNLINLTGKDNACVSFKTPEEAAQAVAAMGGTELEGKTLEVDIWTA